MSRSPLWGAGVYRKHKTVPKSVTGIIVYDTGSSIGSDMIDMHKRRL